MTFSNKYLYDVKDKDPSWRESAKCKNEDVNLFMSNSKQEINDAKAICIGCPVLKQCLDYAITNDIPYGVWGGTSQSERKSMKRKARIISRADSFINKTEQSTSL